MRKNDRVENAPIYIKEEHRLPHMKCIINHGK